MSDGGSELKFSSAERHPIRYRCRGPTNSRSCQVIVRSQLVFKFKYIFKFFFFRNKKRFY